MAVRVVQHPLLAVHRPCQVVLQPYAVEPLALGGDGSLLYIVPAGTEWVEQQVDLHLANPALLKELGSHPPRRDFGESRCRPAALEGIAGNGMMPGAIVSRSVIQVSS